MPTTRDTIVDTISDWARTEPHVRAAWLGGSDANGRVDQHSDVDLVVIAAREASDGSDDPVAACFASVEATLERLSPITHRWHVPEPAWHGHSQRFYRLADTPETCAIDVVVMRRDSTERFLEPERHGTPNVLVDHDGLVAAHSLDRDALRQRMTARREQIAQQLPFGAPLARKALARGHLAEAMHFHLGFIVRPLVDLMRMEHAPDRFDFGLRYLDRDVSATDRALVESICMAGDADALRDAIARGEHAIRERLTSD